MIAAKFGDPVVGVDVHMVTLPPPAPAPVPLPHLFVGVVFDPIGACVGAAIAGVFGGGPVIVNGMIAGNTGTEVRGYPHVPTPPGIAPAPFDIPDNEATLFTGSKTVSFAGSSESRTGSVALSCSYPIDLPTSFCLAVPMGAPVLIGGPEAVDYMVAAGAGLKAGFKAAARTKWGQVALKKAAAKADDALKKVSAKAHRALNAAPDSARSKIICFLTGHPVDVMTGELIAEAVDVHVPGLIPLVWERNYRSRETEEGALGPGWFHPFDEHVRETERGLVVRLPDGRRRDHGALQIEASEWEGEERYTLRRTPRGYERRTADGLRHQYETAHGKRHLLSAIVDPAGNALRFTHARGFLVAITDTAGRRFDIAWTRARRIEGVYFERKPLVRYGYHADGRLAAAFDAHGEADRYTYQGGVLIEETHKNGLAFHFEWDWAHPEGHCVRTWGDGGIFDRRITYDGVGRITTVDDGRGGRHHYWGNAYGLVVKEMDPAGVVVAYTWDDCCRKTSETDGLGHKRTWQYDARGNCVASTDPLGNVIRRVFDADDRIVERTAADGGTWRVTYDRTGKPAWITNPLGAATRYTHDAHGRLLCVEDAMGRATRYVWTERHDIARTERGSAFVTYAHDALSRLLATEDALGRVTRVTRDEKGRVVDVARPDGEQLRLRYDAEDNVLERADARGRITRFAYDRFGKLIAHTDPMGYVVRFAYDLEEEVVRVENQAGEVHEITRDAAGRTRTEIGFDGRTMHAYRDAAGRVTRIVGPDARVTFLTRDALGRVVAQKHPDLEETFAFDARGNLVAATSGEVEIRFERDLVGRVVHERRTSGGVTRDVESAYDPAGLRVARTTNLAHRAAYTHDVAGALTAMHAGLPTDLERPELRALGLPIVDQGDYSILIQRDRMGAEVTRYLPGDVRAEWALDEAGRPAERAVFTGARERSRKAYHYSAPGQLGEIVDAIDGATRYEHDARGHLIRARFGDGTEQVRASDATSNVYRDPSRRDRRYARGGRFERDAATGCTYRYDGTGNLLEKTLTDGAVWRYRWDHAGRLVEVTRPDQAQVTFQYDAFGRRVAKAFKGNVTEYVWDGDELVHERVSRASGEGEEAEVAPLVTWLFEPGTFRLAAKLEGTKRYGVVTDQIGAPAMLVSEAGRIAWQAQLDLYGVPRATASDATRAAEVEATENPWRFPGQYEDAETGLFYNRFRYYDPQAGRYISQDLIGLGGGLALYGYVQDPSAWIDPLGLTACKSPENFAFAFYKRAGWDDARIDEHIAGIDYARVLTVEYLPPGTRVVQYRLPDRRPGNYFTDPGVPRDTLGVKPDGRLEEVYETTQEVKVLKSTADSALDKWSDKAAPPYPARGGGTQYFFPDLGGVRKVT